MEQRWHRVRGSGGKVKYCREGEIGMGWDGVAWRGVAWGGMGWDGHHLCEPMEIPHSLGMPALQREGALEEGMGQQDPVLQEQPPQPGSKPVPALSMPWSTSKAGLSRFSLQRGRTALDSPRSGSLQAPTLHPHLT